MTAGIISFVNSIRSRARHHCCVCGQSGRTLYRNLKDRIFFVPGNWSILQCQDCRHMWLHPQPISEEISKLYEKYFIPENEAKKKRSRGWRDLAKRSIMRNVFGYDQIPMTKMESMVGYFFGGIKPLIDLVGSSIRWLHAKKGKLLDVGCGSGQYLSQMRTLGWEVRGMEPNPDTSNIGRHYYGLDILQEPFEKAPFPDDYFDAITMNHVLEHLPNPRLALEQCHRLLKPGGVFIAIMPNNESMGHRIFRSSYISLDPPRHLNLFSIKSLYKLLIKSSLQIVKLRSLALVGHSEWSLSRLLKKRIPPLSININRFLKYEEKIFYIVEQILNPMWNVGEQIVLKATKINRSASKT